MSQNQSLSQAPLLVRKPPEEFTFWQKLPKIPSVSTLIQSLVAAGSGVLVSMTWIVTAKIARIHASGYYWPLAFQYFGAAVALYVIPIVRHREFLRLSYKSAQAAVTLSVLFFFVPGLIYFASLKELPPVLGAMTLGLVPLFLWIYRIGIGKYRLLFLALAFAGIVLFYLGSVGRDHISLYKTQLLVYFFVGAFIFSIGIAFCKKVLWIHSAQDLTCFAMLFASVFFGICGLLFRETPFPEQAYRQSYNMWLLVLGPIITGLGAHAYRFVATTSSRIGTMIITAIIPLGALVSSYIMHRAETPINAYTGFGFTVFLVSLVLASRSERPGHWMSHHFNNTRRKGDRVLCRLEGYLKLPKGSLARFELMDISIGGLGFHCDSAFAVGDLVMVNIPLGENWTQVSMEGRIMHFAKSNNKEMPYMGGVEFLRMREDILQVLVEFLARLSPDQDFHVTK
jgi:hypothetical protein